MQTLEMEQPGSPAPHESKWYVRMSPRIAVLTVRQLDAAFRQGLIDRHTLVANGALPTWTSLGKLADLSPVPSTPRREPITEKRRRAPAPPLPPPTRSLPVAPPAVAPEQTRRLVRAIPNVWLWAIALLLGVAALALGYAVIEPPPVVEPSSLGQLQQLPQLQPKLPSAPAPVSESSALIPERRDASAGLEPLPILRASSLPLVATRRDRQRHARNGLRSPKHRDLDPT